MITDFRNIHVNYERLRRHYERCVSSFDEVSLYDLAHALRMWMDMKILADKFLVENNIGTNLLSYKVSKKLARLVTKKEHIIAGLPGGVATWASNQKIMEFSQNDKPRSFSSGVKAMIEGSGRINVAQIIVVFDYVINQEEIKILNKGILEQRHNFSQWLNSEIVRAQYVNSEGVKERKIISREIFIGRVANILGGSHPIADHNSDNQFNDAVRYLMNFNIAGLPTPYFLVLKVAKDILDNFKTPRAS